MFRGRNVTSKFRQFKKSFFFSFWIFLGYVEHVTSLDHLYCFWSCCLEHSQQENFLNQSYQKLHIFWFNNVLYSISYLDLILNWKALIIVIYPMSVFFSILNSWVNKKKFIDKLS